MEFTTTEEFKKSEKPSLSTEEIEAINKKRKEQVHAEEELKNLDWDKEDEIPTDKDGNLLPQKPKAEKE